MFNKIFSTTNLGDKIIWTHDRWVTLQDFANDIIKKCELLKNLNSKNNIAIINRNNYETLVNIMYCVTKKKSFVILSNLEIAGSNLNMLNCGLILDGKKNILLRNPVSKNKTAKNPILILLTSSSKYKFVVHDVIKIINFYYDRTMKSPPERRRIVLTFPLDHMAGLNLILKAWMSGGCVVIPKNINIQSICNAIAKSKANILPATPTLLRLLLLSDLKNKIKSIGTITYGAETMDQTTLNKLNKEFKSVKIIQTYGLTEMGVVNINSKSNDSTFFQFREDDRNMYKIKKNILYFRKPQFFIGYFNKKIYRAKKWFCTNDVVDVSGNYIRVVCRLSDQINVAGLKVEPTEVEAVLLLCRFVTNAFVYGENCAVLGNRVVAEIVSKSKISSDELSFRIRSHCLNLLPKFKTPQKIIFVDKINYSNRFKRIKKI